MKRLAVALGLLLVAVLDGGCAARRGPASVSDAGASVPSSIAPQARGERVESPRKTLRLAREAMASGRLSEALGRFESVLAREQEAGSRRAEALYGAGMLRTAPEPGLRDLAGARAHLGEFRSAYPLHERSFEAGLAIGWMEEVADLGQRLDGLRREIEDREEAAGVEKARAAAELAVAREQIAAIEARVAELEPLTKEVESLKAEVRALQEEIQKKDQALKRVKAAVVGSRARP